MLFLLKNLAEIVTWGMGQDRKLISPSARNQKKNTCRPGSRADLFFSDRNLIAICIGVPIGAARTTGTIFIVISVSYGSEKEERNMASGKGHDSRRTI